MLAGATRKYSFLAMATTSLLDQASVLAGRLSPEEIAFEKADESFQTWSPDLVYGELLEEPFLEILAKARSSLPPAASSSSPSFLDIGSGKGRLVIAAALSGRCSPSVGVELVPRLHREACRLLRAVRREQDEKGEGSHDALASFVCADMFDPLPTAVEMSEDEDKDEPGAPIKSLRFSRTVQTTVGTTDDEISPASRIALTEKARVPLQQGAFDIVLVNGLCFEEETLKNCLAMLLLLDEQQEKEVGAFAAAGDEKKDADSTGGASDAAAPRWHVRKAGGILLLTSVILPSSFLESGVDGGKAAAKLLWEEECSGTSWGRPVMVRAYQRV